MLPELFGFSGLLCLVSIAMLVLVLVKPSKLIGAKKATVDDQYSSIVLRLIIMFGLCTGLFGLIAMFAFKV